MVALVVALLGIVIPAVSSMWEQRKGAETETLLRGVLATARAQAYHDKERGLFFVLEGDTQRIYPLEAEPYDPVDDPADPSDDVSMGVSEELAANRFRISDGKVQTLPKPFRAAPRAVVDEEGGSPVWSATEVSRLSYRGPPSTTLERHRNFFTMILSPDGRLLVDRPVLIHDAEADGDNRGDRTGLQVGGVTSWYDGQSEQTLSATLPHVIDDSAGWGVNFQSVDGLLVYDDSSFAALPTEDLRREHLIDTGLPLYVSRLSGRVIRGPRGENE